jgi:putative SOS response-associated peptidase YedK
MRRVSFYSEIRSIACAGALRLPRRRKPSVRCCYEEQPNFPARYNVAPTQPIPIVRIAEGQRRFAFVRWGLLPSWVKDPRTFSLLINARGESVLDKPAFRAAMRRRRCLIPVDGFYEWKREGAGKRAYYIRAKNGGVMAFAGLWEVWTGPNGEELESAAIVTTAANLTLAGIHDRMPVILAAEAFDLWLDCENVDAETAATLIGPAREDLLEVYPVSSQVNRTANDTAALIEPEQAAIEPAAEPVVAAPIKRARKPAKDDRQPSLF